MHFPKTILLLHPGLPSDSFSTENGVIVTRCIRWPLMIDPQCQAIKWIRNMESQNGLKTIDLQQNDFLRSCELAVQFGLPLLLQVSRRFLFVTPVR